MSLELAKWFVDEIKKNIVGFDDFDITRAHNVREYAMRAKAIKLTDRAIKRSLVKKYKVKFI